MKVIISSQGHHEDDLVDVRFGRCAYFAVWDSNTNTFEFIENKGKSSDHGAGLAAAQQVIDLNGDALLSERLGPKAFRVLDQSGIHLYKCHGMTLRDAVERLKTHDLEMIKEAYR